MVNSTALYDVQMVLPEVGPGLGRSAVGQMGYQVLALGVTMLIAIVGGCITGNNYVKGELYRCKMVVDALMIHKSMKKKYSVW